MELGGYEAGDGYQVAVYDNPSFDDVHELEQSTVQHSLEVGPAQFTDELSSPPKCLSPQTPRSRRSATRVKVYTNSLCSQMDDCVPRMPMKTMHASYLRHSTSLSSTSPVSLATLQRRVVSLKKRLWEEQATRKALELSIKETRYNASREIEDLQLELYRTQETLMATQQKLQAADAQRNVLLAQSSSLQASLQEAAHERTALEQQLSRISMDDDVLLKTCSTPTTTQARRHSLSSSTTTPSECDASDGPVDETTHAGCELPLKLIATPLRYYGSASVKTPSPRDIMGHEAEALVEVPLQECALVDIRDENQRLTAELISRKVELAEVVGQQLILVRELEVLKQVNKQLLAQVQKLMDKQCEAEALAIQLQRSQALIQSQSEPWVVKAPSDA